MKKDTSIEYAHIYTNNQIGEEHHLSLEILGGLKEQEDKLGRTTSLVVMVDDYSFPDPSFDYASFLAWLSEKGFTPDIVLRESQLVPLCDEVVTLIEDEKLKKELVEYVRVKKYPCSLFIAAWYLLRLGHISASFFDQDLSARKVINILPLSFKPFEDKALEIIASTKFADSVKNIEYKYFEGRKI